MNPLSIALPRAALFAASLAALSFVAPAPAMARTVYDGAWSVLIVTNKGSCDRAYRYGVSIVDGRVVYNGTASVNLNGRVASNGAVRVTVSAGSQRADGSGRLTQRSGSGTWRSAAGDCSGTWTAERR
jgi:hypothetical protein